MDERLSLFEVEFTFWDHFSNIQLTNEDVISRISIWGVVKPETRKKVQTLFMRR